MSETNELKAALASSTVTVHRFNSRSGWVQVEAEWGKVSVYGFQILTLADIDVLVGQLRIAATIAGLK